MKLLARSRGNLPEFMDVSERGGEEHFGYQGRVMLSVACDLLARWMLGGNKADLDPITGVVMVAEDRGERWIMNRARVNEASCKDLFGEALYEKSPKMNVFAHQIDFYDLGRETGAAKAFAHVERRHGSNILTFLDASADEVAGMIHECAAVHVRCDDGFSTREFLSEVQPRKAETPKKKEGTEKTAEEITREAKNAALLWQLENRRTTSAW